MTAKKLKVCLIGIGNIGLLHLDMYHLTPDQCEVIVVDQDTTKRKNAEDRGSKFFETLEEALSYSEFDIIDISAPTNLHYELASKALSLTNAALIIEKPITQNLDQSLALKEMQEKSGRIIMCAMVERFFLPFQKIKSWCDNVGGPFELEFVRRTMFPRSQWLSDPLKGGEVTLDLGVHDIDLLHWFTNSVPDQIIKFNPANKLQSDLSATMQDGSTAKLSFGWDIPADSSNGLINMVRVKSGEHEISYNSINNEIVIDGVRETIQEQRIPSAYQGELLHIMDCVRSGTTPTVTSDESYQIMKSLDMIEQAIAPAILTASKLALHGGSPIRSSMPAPVSPYGPGELEAVLRVMRSGTVASFRGGKEVKAFEEEYANFIGTRFAIATTSGTTALHTSLAAFNLSALGEFIEVAVPALTFISTASVVLQENLRPVFIDVDNHFCMDPIDLKRKITSNMKAMIPVHLYGQPADMASLTQIADEYNIKIIEDAAQAHGAIYAGQKVGSLGHFGCFSMFEFKNMGCGEGGMITLNDPDLYREARLVREHGSPADGDTWYNYQRLGYNYNMTDLQAAIGREQLKKLPEKNQRRVENATRYAERLAEMGLILPLKRDNVENVHHLFPVLLPASMAGLRDTFVKALQAEGIPLSVAYPHPLYQTPVFKNRGYGNSVCPSTEDKTARLFTLFTDAGIDDQLINDTGNAIEKVLSSMRPR